MNVEDELRELELLRCKAIVDRDLNELGRLMADDLVHIHGNGGTDDKAGYLHGIETKYDFHQVERGPLLIRCYGDVAVVSGPLKQVFSLKGADERHVVDAMTSQVWVRTSGRWRQSTCHNQFLQRP